MLMRHILGTCGKF